MTSADEIEKAGKQSGLEVWRIENMEMKTVAPDQFGYFYTGDSYIVLQTRSFAGSHFSWNLHFWLGNESSQDERGAAAILATQLDDYLGGTPVQYREIQNKESPIFRGYFRNGITYKKGGVQSGFKHVRTNVNEVRRVLHVKGRRIVRATEVDMNWKVFNKGDIFIIEVENDIFQWNGSMSNRYERLKACEIVNSIKNNEKGGKGTIHVINEGERIPPVLKDALNGSPDDVQPEMQDDGTSTNERATLYHVSSDTGQLVVTAMGTAPFKQDQLLTGDCYILDNGTNGSLFVWKGKKASKDERSGAMQNAIEFIENHNYHSSTKIQMMVEGAESVLFTQFFNDWKRKDQTVGRGKVYRHENIAKVEKIKFDVTTLYDKPKLAAEHHMVDDGSGKVEVWRVERNKLVPVQEESCGHFFAGDSYVILYTYAPKRKEEYIIYTWQGLDSTKDEIAASAIHSKFLDDKYHQRPVQCRVVQGKEPQHMLSIFGHPIIISNGGYDKAAGGNVGVSQTALYQIRSTSLGGTKLIEVALSASMLNSNDAFLIKNNKNGYIWIGSGANDLEIDAAQYGAKKMNINEKVVTVKEGEEDHRFWGVLGGKKDYASSPRLLDDLEINPPRLFAISNAKGRMFVEEIPGEFAQSDLEPDDVMMLDAWDQVFIWIGEGANKEERSEAPKIVGEYISHDPRGRDANCPVNTVKMSAEPITFTGFFPSWDTSYFEKRKHIIEQNML